MLLNKNSIYQRVYWIKKNNLIMPLKQDKKVHYFITMSHFINSIQFIKDSISDNLNILHI